MIAACRLWLLAGLLGAPAPPPSVEPPQAEPAPEPASEPVVEPQPTPEGGSIEFAVPPPSQPGEGPDEEGPAPAEPAGQWPDPGQAPSDGVGAIVSGAILIPVASLATWVLLDGKRVNADNGNIPIVVTGVGLDAIGLGLIGLGIARRIKLRRWETAYRVRATWQGNGMLATGALALNFGVVAALSGTLALTNQTSDRVGYGLLAGGLIAAGAIAPPMLVFGMRRSRRYRQTGGWVRPPLPPIPTSPSVTLIPGGIALGVRGQF